MATRGNNASGTDSMAAIWRNSLFLRYYMKQSSNGRKPLISSEYMDMSRDNLMGLTLVDKSMFLLIPTILPEIYMYSNNDLMRNGMRGYANYITQTARSVDGIPDLALDVQQATWKTSFFNIPMFTNLQNPTTEVTLAIPAELAGYTITNITRHWMNQISDEYSRSAPYNGMTIEFNNWSHSMGMMYIKPNKNYTRVEYGAMWFLMVPKVAPTSNFNADASSPGVAEVNLTFSVNVIDHRNLKVAEVLDSALAKYRELFVMDSTMYGLINNTHLASIDEVNLDNAFAIMRGN